MINIFGKDIPTRKYTCITNNLPAQELEPALNLYLRFIGCNARCSFCYLSEEFLSTNPLIFDIDKYEIILKEMRDKNVKVNKISFSGGEPTLNLELLEKLMKISLDYYPDSYTTINTNGKNLEKFMNNEVLIDYTDSISLSRHHYNDELNDKTFNTKTISNNKLREIKKLDKYNALHFNCNIIKGYIDSEEEIYNFLEFSSEIGINSVGFSGLMLVNDFCKENIVDLNSFKLINDRFNLVQKRELPNSCQCKNYIYIPKELNNVVKVYHKHSYNTDNLESSLTYDGKNLVTGYGKDIVF